MENVKKIVYDAPIAQQKQHQYYKKNNYKWKNHNKQVHNNQYSNENEIESIPMELIPLIVVAKEYGRKTHALGSIKFVSILNNIINKLKSINEIENNSSILELIKESEIESKKIIDIFSKVYNEET